jgi:hypothetical protein
MFSTTSQATSRISAFWQHMSDLRSALPSKLQTDVFYGAGFACPTRWLSLGKFLELIVREWTRVNQVILGCPALRGAHPLSTPTRTTAQAVLRRYNFRDLLSCISTMQGFLTWTERLAAIRFFFFNFWNSGLLNDEMAWLALTNFIQGSCYLSDEMISCLIEARFLEHISILFRQAADAEVEVDHNLLLNSIRIARRIWRYQLREDPDIDIGDMVETLESFPWPCEFHAAKILSVWRDLVRSVHFNESFAVAVCSYMNLMFTEFLSTNIGVSACKTARAIVQIVPTLVSVVAEQDFFVEIVNHFQNALEYPSDDFAPVFFHLMLDMVACMDPDPASKLFHAIGYHEYLYIIVIAAEPTAAACLELLTFACVRNDADAGVFQEVASLLYCEWECGGPVCPRLRQQQWLKFCHALLWQLGPTAVALLIPLRVIEIASLFLNVPVEVPLAAGSEHMGYCIHLLSMMMQGCST